jgi:hypothetical protein
MRLFRTRDIQSFFSRGKTQIRGKEEHLFGKLTITPMRGVFAGEFKRSPFTPGSKPANYSVRRPRSRFYALRPGTALIRAAGCGGSHFIVADL